MRKTLLGLMVVAALGCVKDKECRNGTVMVTFNFANGPELVDGIALRYRLDGGPMADLAPLVRPVGATQGTLELEVKSYAGRKSLVLSYAARKGEQIVGPWLEQAIDLRAGCTAVELTVGIGTIGPTVDATAGMDVGSRAETGGTLDSSFAEAASLAKDAVVDTRADAGVIEPADGQGTEPDAPLPPPADAAEDGPVGRDAPSEPVRLQPVDSGADVAWDAGSSRETTVEVSADVSTSTCVIDSLRYAANESQPGNACQICDPATSTSSWTRAVNGTACGSGQVCADGLCRAGCFVEGAFYQSAAAKPGNTCRYCNPTLSPNAWTVEKDGTSCGNGQGCSGGECGAGCWISGSFYVSGAAQAGNACLTCQPGTSATDWTPVPNGGGCGAGQICNAALCVAGCWIDGGYQSATTPKPGDPCHACVPATSVSSWSNAPNGTSCGAEQVCNAGSCAVGCWIASAYYESNVKKTGNACLSCQPGQSTTDWTKAGDGITCGDGLVCTAGTCKSGCWIDSVFHPPGDRPGNACQQCDPAVSTSAWTNKVNGTACGNGQQCSAGVCGDGCNIGGTFYATGTKNPSNDCQSCQPGASTTTWSNLPDRSPCGTAGQVCSGGVCGDCVPGDTRCKDENVQQLCQSTRKWVDNTTCTYGCNSSTNLCNPECRPPNEKRCLPGSSIQPQQCDATGRWLDVTACGSDYQCAGGTCLKKDGVVCGSAAECVSSVCNLYYYDGDGDGYYGSASKYCGSSPPAGWKASASGADCCDSDSRARPGQTAGFATASACGSFDFDCDGAITKLPETYVPANGACDSCWCFWCTDAACQACDGLPACGQGSVSYWYCGPYGNENYCTDHTMPCR